MPKKKEKDEDYVYSSDEDDESEQRMSSPAKLKRELKKCSLEKRILEHKLEIKNLSARIARNNEKHKDEKLQNTSISGGVNLNRFFNPYYNLKLFDEII